MTLRIAVLSTMGGAAWGGSEELWAAMVRNALAHQHSVLLSLDAAQRVAPNSKQLAEQGVRFSFRERPFLRLSGRLDRSWGRLARPLQSLVRFDPDVVCISMGSAYDLALDPMLFDEFERVVMRRAVPYVLIIQHNDDSSPSDWLRARQIRLVDGAKQVVLVAERNRESLERQLARHVNQGVVVRNPLNLEGREGVPWPRATDPGVSLACVARLQVAYKGQDILLEALSRADLPGPGWRLTFYGEGPDRSYLERLAEFYGIADRIAFAGHVSDIRHVWARHQMLVLPSRSEGTPLALAEAMICGRPAVVSPVGGNPEVVIDGETGFVAPDAAAGGLASALERALGSFEKWELMGERARAMAQEIWVGDPGEALLRLAEGAASGKY